MNQSAAFPAAIELKTEVNYLFFLNYSNHKLVSFRFYTVWASKMPSLEEALAGNKTLWILGDTKGWSRMFGRICCGSIVAQIAAATNSPTLHRGWCWWAAVCTWRRLAFHRRTNRLANRFVRTQLQMVRITHAPNEGGASAGVVHAYLRCGWSAPLQTCFLCFRINFKRGTLSP